VLGGSHMLHILKKGEYHQSFCRRERVGQPQEEPPVFRFLIFRSGEALNDDTWNIVSFRKAAKCREQIGWQIEPICGRGEEEDALSVVSKKLKIQIRPVFPAEGLFDLRALEVIAGTVVDDPVVPRVGGRSECPLDSPRQFLRVGSQAAGHEGNHGPFDYGFGFAAPTGEQYGDCATLAPVTTAEHSVVLVAGGAGAVGEGIVAALLDAGATVAVPSRDQGSLDRLRDNVGAADHLLGVVGDVADPDDAERVCDEVVGTLGPPHAVIVAIGGWASGPKLADTALAEWDAIIARDLRTHQVVASTYVPLLRGRPGATYGVIIGDTALAPAAGAGPVSVTAAAELMAARVLGLEEREAGVQVEAFILAPVITRNRPKGPPEWLTAREVGEAITRRIAARGGLTTAGETAVVKLSGRDSAIQDGSAG